MNKKAFSLIELLIAIAIMAVLMAIALPNFIGARERARDAKRKAEFAQLKSALRMYYNDYGHYPAGSGLFMGCGVGGVTRCPNTTSGCTSFQFSAGGTGCSVIYMKTLPSSNYKYYQINDGDGFYACYDKTMENTSDPENLTSQTKCQSGTADPKTYCVCND